LSAVVQGPIIVAERYRVEREIGRGGSGEVLEVSDLITGRRLALKRLRMHHGGESHLPMDADQLASQLRHEFLILSQLAHPSVVAVHDFGTERGMPYYTMELLRGQHPGARGAFGWREVWRMLVSLSEPLALLHSRRLVHRDISPRNVFLEADGSAKLIDFGAMASMSGHHRPVGTPSVMAPEVLRREQLDGRADIYGLGALAYCALTGQHAYAVRALTQLPLAWQTPIVPPSELVADVPHAFEQLLVSMLSLEREGRPQSIAELMQRLFALHDLAPEPRWRAPPAALAAPVLVGCERQLEAIDGYVARAKAGRGQACVVRGEPGSGRSRLLEALGQRAESAGMRVVRASAGLLDGSPFCVLRELSQALDPAPPDADSCMGSALGRLHGDQPLPHDDAQSVELQAAFIEFCEQLSDAQPLCLVVDDSERADASSTRVLAQLVRRVASKPLLLALAGGNERVPGNTALGSLLRQAVWIETSPLDADSCEAVVRSVFGDVPKVARVARWAHRHSRGHPGACMALLEYVVSAGAAKFVTGSWELPADPDGLRLPEHGPEQLELALHRRAAGRNLLELLSLVTRPFPLELSQYAAAAPEAGARALDELVQAQLVLATNQGYVIRDPSALDWAARQLEPHRRRELQLILARSYEQHGPQFAIQVAYHAWQAGDLASADQLLKRIEQTSDYGLRSLVWRSGGLAVPPRLFEDLLAHRKREGAAPADLYALRGVLLAVTVVSDVEMVRFAGETLDQLRHDVGLDFWDQTDRELPDSARTLRCFELARARYEASPAAERGLPVERATLELISCIAMLGAACTFSYNVELARKIAELMAPLRELSATSRVIAKSTQITHDSLVLGDRAIPLRREVMAATTLPAASDIEPVTRDAVHYITNYYLALDLAADGRAEALELAAELETQPIYEVLGLQVRRTHALGCGQFDEAQRLRRRRELLALRTERSDNLLEMALLREQQAAFHCSDLLELNRALGALRAKARRFPDWQPWVELCRAQLQFRADETDAAHEVLEAAIAQLAPFGHDAWQALRALLCEVKNDRREYAATQKLALTTLEGAAGLGIELTSGLRLHAALAVAEAGLGDASGAARRIKQLIDVNVSALGPHSVAVGMLRESACRVALIAKDYVTFSTELAALGESYANHPGLRSRHASWVRQGKQRFRGLIAVLEKANAAKDWSARIASRLSAHSAEDRSEYLLSFVLDQLEIDAGQLYRVTRDGKCELLASRPGADEPELMAAVEHSLITWWSSEEGQTGDEETDSALLRDSQGRLYLPLWLTKPTHAEELAGVVLLNCSIERLSGLTPAFVKAVALHLDTIA
jgi:hypothetical protein